MTTMDHDPAGDGKGWTVTGQTETAQLDGGNKFVDGYAVAFRTQYGDEGTVFVPRARYNPTQVTAEITAQAATLDAVHHLTGA